MSPMYKYFENMRKMGRLTDAQIENALIKGYITATEADALYGISNPSF